MFSSAYIPPNLVSSKFNLKVIKIALSLLFVSKRKLHFDSVGVVIVCCCAVDGGWSDFGDWNECSAKCGGGIMTRKRTCTNPPPSNGGACCVGDNLEAKICNANSCSGNIFSSLPLRPS